METPDVVAAPSEEIVPLDEGDECCEEEKEATPDPYLCTHPTRRCCEAGQA